MRKMAQQQQQSNTPTPPQEQQQSKTGSLLLFTGRKKDKRALVQYILEPLLYYSFLVPAVTAQNFPVSQPASPFFPFLLSVNASLFTASRSN
ncbi:hypothetical protein K457DRAFT_377930 [Linnemannia elongata AG-77]|uniref:Uncharacterized protein n=1 Tax=Linnemannia elongata AG-77 TaxID=1314771 RepID=A0A197KHU5_9FUNG|nr:hypothetical protein K457DRAFT_377930 [Linnemannia elongata AG-77]